VSVDAIPRSADLESMPVDIVPRHVDREALPLDISLPQAGSELM
jgi:hypothetical protein